MTDRSLKVSVVTPSYNAMPYLKETIESILCQDYPNVQHIVMDGGSSDGSKELLASYPGIVWRSEKDKGQSDALNKAFALADGEIIGWLNADDTYTDGAMKEAVAFLEEHVETDIVCSDVNIIDENSRVIGKSIGREITLTNILIDNPIKQPSIFMRRRVIEALRGLDTNLHFVMDREFWLRAVDQGFKICYLPNKTFANFRLCEGTKTFESTPKFRQEWHQVLSQFFDKSGSAVLTEKIKRKIINKNHSQFYLSQSQKEIGKTTKFLKSIILSAYYDSSILLNLGYYKLCILGLLRMKRNKY